MQVRSHHGCMWLGTEKEGHEKGDCGRGWVCGVERVLRQCQEHHRLQSYRRIWESPEGKYLSWCCVGLRVVVVWFDVVVRVVRRGKGG